MTFDLTEARRLHDRDPAGPEHCLSGCLDWDNFDPAADDHDSIPYRQDWPCKTAVALGATGRSEWTDEPPTSEPIAPAPDCSYSSAEGQCILNAGHRPGHVTRITDTPRCAAMRSGLTCVMQINHTGNCIDRDGIQWNACPISRSSMGEIWPCTRYANHPDSHHDQNGATW